VTKQTKQSTPVVDLALQGGGAHGAFTWGVLDGLLADERIEIEAISGSSAGAMNAVVVAEGLVEGGRAQARLQLERFWQAVSTEAQFSPIRRTAWDVMNSNWNLDSNPMLAAFDAFTRTVSPYVYNPLNLNPLRQLLLSEVDFVRVQRCDTMKVFVAATNVHTGQARLFTGTEITADAVLASACLPYLFPAIEIGGTPYWDGGYSGNPPLRPFLKSCRSEDILLVQINPVERPETPKSSREILDRINEITFNSTLLKELEHVEFVNAALERGDLQGKGYRPIHLHRIGGEGAFAALSASSKLNAEWPFLVHLRDLGKSATAAWLENHFDALGNQSTIHAEDLRQGDRSIIGRKSETPATPPTRK